MKTIAIVGVSGVGKSTMIARMRERYEFLHLQASALIKSEQVFRQKIIGTSEELRLGAVLDNQTLLIAAFRRLTEGDPPLVVFDGHTIIDGVDGLVALPAEVFGDIGCQRMIYMREEPDTIVERRQRDTRRTRPQIDAIEIARHQEFAITTGRSICETLAISFFIIDGSDCEALAAALI